MKNPNRVSSNQPLASPRYSGTHVAMQTSVWPNTGYWAAAAHVYPTLGFDLGKEYFISRIVIMIDKAKTHNIPHFFYASWEPPIVTGMRAPQDQPPMVICSRYNRQSGPVNGVVGMNCEDCTVAGKWIVAEKVVGPMTFASIGVYGMEIPPYLLNGWKKLYNQIH